MEDTEIVQSCVDRLREVFGHPTIEDEWHKIDTKLKEARYNPGEVRVFADCILALLLAARSQGFSVDTVVQDLVRLCKDLPERNWKKMPDGTYQAF